MPSRWICIKPSVVFFKNKIVWLLKTFVLSVVLKVVVEKGSLLSCVVVVVIRK